MYRIIVVILISSILFNVVGYQVMFNILQELIQESIELRIKYGLKKEELVVITISSSNKSEIKWLRPDKEFMYKGEMYDVVKIKKEGNKKNYYCICDIKEKQLITKYQKTHEKRKNEDRKLKQSKNIKLFFQQITLSMKIFFCNYFYCKYFNNIQICYLNVPIPPPKMIS